MRRRELATYLALVAVGAVRPGTARAAELSASDIMSRNFFTSKVKHLRTASTMTLVTDKGETRVRSNTTIVKLQPNGIDSTIMVKFHSPAEIKGTGFLLIEHSQSEDDQWIYLPALKKSRRLVANNKKDSFVGSDFSYGDVSLPRVESYKHALLRSESVAGADCYVVESIPGTDDIRSSSGYSKKVSWIRKDNFIEAKVEYYDLGGRALKSQATSGYKQVDASPERWFAQRREMVNHQTGHKTVLVFDNLNSVDVPSDDLFSIRSLEHE